MDLNNTTFILPILGHAQCGSLKNIVLVLMRILCDDAKF